MTPSEQVIAALKEARDTFQSYGDQHAAKTPPQPIKAEVNYAMVAKINAALLALAHEAVGLSDNMQPELALELDAVVKAGPGPAIIYNEPPAHPAKERLARYLDTLVGRADDSWTEYGALIGDLRALTK